MARAGKRTRTLTAEEPRAEKGGGAGYAVMPSQLFIDLFVDDKKLAVRHASEGGADPEIVLDLTGCKPGADLDKVFANTAKILIVGTGMLDPLFASVRANVDAAMANAEDRLPVHLLNPNIPRQCLSTVKLAELKLHQGVLTSLGAKWPTPLALDDIQRLYT